MMVVLPKRKFVKARRPSQVEANEYRLIFFSSFFEFVFGFAIMSLCSRCSSASPTVLLHVVLVKLASAFPLSVTGKSAT